MYVKRCGTRTQELQGLNRPVIRSKFTQLYDSQPDALYTPDITVYPMFAWQVFGHAYLHGWYYVSSSAMVHVHLMITESNICVTFFLHPLIYRLMEQIDPVKRRSVPIVAIDYMYSDIRYLLRPLPDQNTKYGEYDMLSSQFEGFWHGPMNSLSSFSQHNLSYLPHPISGLGLAAQGLPVSRRRRPKRNVTCRSQVLARDLRLIPPTTLGRNQEQALYLGDLEV